MFKTLMNAIARIDTRYLIGACLAMSFGVFLVAMSPIVGSSTGNPIRYLLFSLAFVCFALSGVVSIVRRETYLGFFYVEGIPAIVVGLMVTLIGVFEALLPVIAIWFK